MADIRISRQLTMTLIVGGQRAIGATPAGHRRNGLVFRSTFKGDRLPGGPVYDIFEVL